jgi:hypothetical protein
MVGTMSASVVVRAAVGTMVGTSRRAGVDVGECAGVAGLELELEGARMAEVTIGGCLILDGEDGVGGDHLDHLDVGTQHRTGGNRFCTSASIFFSFLETFFFMLCLIYAYVQWLFRSFLLYYFAPSCCIT